jgi:hypothetical protein
VRSHRQEKREADGCAVVQRAKPRAARRGEEGEGEEAEAETVPILHADTMCTCVVAILMRAD